MTVGLANLLTLLRMGLVPLFIIAVLEGHPGQALVVFAVAGVTDALDGFVARWSGTITRVGIYLDPVADKLLLMTAFVVLALPGDRAGLTIPVWITVLVLTRDALIVIVALVLYLALGHVDFPPSFLSKTNTTVQIVAIVLTLAASLRPDLATTARVALWVTAGTTVASGLDYIRRGHRMTQGRGLPE